MFRNPMAWVAVVAWLALVLLAPTAQAELALDVSPRVVVENSPPLVPREARSPGIATNGSKWLVVYSAFVPYVAPDIKQGSIIGRFVDAEGQPLAPAFQIAQTGNIYDLRVAFDGTSFVVVWVQEVAGAGDANHTVRYLRVSPDGIVTSPPAVLATPTDVAAPLAVSTGETGVLIVVGASDGCHTWLLTADAVEQGDTVGSGEACVPFVGFSEGVWLLAHVDQGGSTKLMQLSGEAQVVAGTSQTVPATIYGDQHSIAPAADGFVVVRENGESLELIKVGLDGSATLLDLVIDNVVGHPNLVAYAGGYALFYVDYGCDNCTYAGHLRLLTPALELEFENPFVLGPGTGYEPSVLEGGQAAVLVWLDDYTALRAGLLPFENLHGIEGVTVLSKASAEQSSPQVAPGEGGWLVAWLQGNIPDDQPDPDDGIRAVRLDASAQPLEEPVTLIPAPYFTRQLLEVARGPGGWLVASCDSYRAYVDRVSDDLDVSSVALPLASSPDPCRLHVTGSPEGWLVAWQRHELGTLSVVSARIEPDGSVKDTQLVYNTAFAVTAPIRATYHEEGYKIVWADDTDVWTGSVPVSGPVPFIFVQKLIDTDGYVGELEVAYGDIGTWWMWLNVNGSTELRTYGGFAFSRQDVRMLPVVAVNGLALTGTWSSFNSGLELALALPASDLTTLYSSPGWSRGDLSEAVGNRVLMATEDWLWREAHLTKRIRTRLLTVSKGLDSGGTGGAGGAETGEAGEPGLPPTAGSSGHDGGSPGKPDAGGGGGPAQPTGDAGSPSQGQEPSGSGGNRVMPGSGGVPAGGIAAIPEDEHAASDQSNGCSCRTVTAPGGAQHLSATLLLLLIGVVRRSMRRTMAKSLRALRRVGALQRSRDL